MIQGGIHSVRFFLLCLTLLLCGTVTYLYTDAGKARVISLALSYANSKNVTVKIEKIESYFPLKVHLSQVKIRENDKTTLSIKNAVVRVDMYEWWANNRVVAAVHIDDLALKEIPESSGNPISSLKIGTNLNLDLTVTSFHVPYDLKNGPSHGNLSNLHVDYDALKDELQAKANAVLWVQNQPLNIALNASGGVNDFALNYEVDGKALNLSNCELSGLKGDGVIQHLPWHPQGAVKMQAKYAGHDALFSSRVSFLGGSLHVEDFLLNAHGLVVKSDVSLNVQTLDIKGMLEAEFKIPEDEKLSPFTGDLKLSSKFESSADNAFLQLSSVGKNLKFNEYGIKMLNLELDGKNLLKEADGKLKGSVKGISSPLGQLDDIDLWMDIHKSAGLVKIALKGPQTSANMEFDLDYTKVEQVVKVHTLQATQSGVHVKLEKPTQISYRKGDVALSPFQLSIMESPIELSGKITKGVLDLRAKGQVDMLAFSRMVLTDNDVANGKLDIDLMVKGPWDKPSLSGGGEVKNGSYERVKSGTSFEDIHIKIKADKDRLTIVEANGKDSDKGHVTASGQYLLMENSFDVQVKGTNAQILRSDKMNLVAKDVSIRLYGTLDKAKISGNLTANSASFNIASQVKSSRSSLNIINPIQRKRLSLPTNPHHALESDDFDPDLDIELNFPPVLKVAGRGLDSYWKGKLKLAGTVENTDILGDLYLDRGSINFLGQNVVLKRGEIRFDGHEDDIPLIDAAGVLEKPDLEVIINVIGRVTKPFIDLQSQPALPKDEIISYLFFGKDKASLSAIEGVQLARALIAYKGGGQSFDLFGAISDNLGLDQISIGSGATEGAYALRLSKRLGDKLRINLNQGITPEDSSVELEVDVTKNISVKAEHGFEGSSDGVSVNYNWDY